MFIFGRSKVVSRFRRAPFLLLPVALLAVVSFVAFRPTAKVAMVNIPLGTPLILPTGWSAPNVPVDNPITMEKFVLGRYLFYEKQLSGDQNTSCGTCHDAKYSFSSGVGARAGAFEHASMPARTVPRLLNLGYDSVYTWDGHLHSLEQQVKAAIVKRGDFEADTNVVKSRLSYNPAYVQLFTRAFGSSEISMERIAQAVATFELVL